MIIKATYICEDCTKKLKETKSWSSEEFYTLNQAIEHIRETQHEVNVYIENPDYDEED